MKLMRPDTMLPFFLRETDIRDQGDRDKEKTEPDHLGECVCASRSEVQEQTRNASWCMRIDRAMADQPKAIR
jgi:hypothetical protein